MWRWLVVDWQWPGAALFAGAFMLVITPLIAGLGGLGLMLVFVQLPLYMAHQWEEHSGDRFRSYINRVISGGREVLTPAATFWINFLGVWAVDLTSLYLAWTVSQSAGLAAGYLSVVNAVVHVVQAIARREYNPGLLTAVLLLLPAGCWCVFQVGVGAGMPAHAIGLATAIGVHFAIIAHVAQRLTQLPKEVKTSPVP